jgi:hypothetical protein
MPWKDLSISFHSVLLWATLTATALSVPIASAAERDRIGVAPGIFLQSVDGLTSARQASRVRDTVQSRPTGRIVGGTPTTISRFPWHTAIAFRSSVSSGNGFQRQFCGGTLLTPTYILTAAHCLHGSDGFTSPALYSAITGRTALSSNAGQEIDFETYFVPVDAVGNPLFDPSRGAVRSPASRQAPPPVTPTTSTLRW